MNCPNSETIESVYQCFIRGTDEHWKKLVKFLIRQRQKMSHSVCPYPDTVESIPVFGDKKARLNEKAKRWVLHKGGEMETFSQVMNWLFAVLALAALVIGYFLVKKRREGE